MDGAHIHTFSSRRQSLLSFDVT